MNFFFDCVFKPFLNWLSLFMQETRDGRKKPDVRREMQPQLKKHLVAQKIRDILKELVKQGNCDDRFRVFMYEDGSQTSLVSVTGEFLIRVRIYQTHFEIFTSRDDPGVMVESEERLKEMVHEHTTNLIRWHREVLTLGGKRR